MTITNSGTIRETRVANFKAPLYQAISALTDDTPAPFWSYAGAAFWLWLIETRIHAEQFRNGKRLLEEGSNK